MTSKSVLRPIEPPLRKNSIGQDEFSDPWKTFFEAMEKHPEEPIDDLSANPTNEELSTAINAILEILRTHGFIQR